MHKVRRSKGVIGAMLVGFGFMLFAMIFMPVVNEVSKALTDAFMETTLAENDMIEFLWRSLPIAGAVACMIGGVVLILQNRHTPGPGQGDE